jgi:hypothetical protein
VTPAEAERGALLGGFADMPGLDDVLRRSLLFALLALCSCAQEPSLRSYVYTQLDDNAVVVSPRVHPPISSNSFPYIPGNLTRPAATTPADPARFEAAEWQTGRFCPISAKAFQFSNVQYDGVGHDVTYTYDFDPVGSIFGFADRERSRAIQDLKLSENDLKYIDRISIVIKNVKIYTVRGDLLGPRSAIPIDPGCARYRNVYPFQIARMYEADIDVQIQSLHGAAVNLALLRAKIMKQYSSREQGNGLVIAIVPRPVTN